MAASQGALGELHQMLAEVLLEDLKQSKAEGIPLPAANLGVIRQFLKDNEITATVDADDMKRLREEFQTDLANKRNERKNSLSNALHDDAFSVILQ